jgi:probable F420-dependent oxidoreductase
MRFTIWNTGGDPDEFFHVAKVAERSGWSSLCLNEGTFQPERQEDDIYPFTADGRRSWQADTPYLEPMTLLPALATHTERLRYLTWVMKLPLREPLMFAKQVATAALMSHNRLDLGVGMSWMPQEFEFLGLDWESRRARFVEAIEVLRLVLTGEMVEYHGEVFDFGRLMERPAPTEPVPILIGGHKERSLRLAAKVADGWCGVSSPVEELERVVGRLRDLLEQEGRSLDGFAIHAGGIDARTVEDYARLAEVGITDCIVMPWMNVLRDAGNDALEVSLSRRLELIEAFGEEIIAPLRRAGVGPALPAAPAAPGPPAERSA